jgi:hypothetical protein
VVVVAINFSPSESVQVIQDHYSTDLPGFSKSGNGSG